MQDRIYSYRKSKAAKNRATRKKSNNTKNSKAKNINLNLSKLF